MLKYSKYLILLVVILPLAACGGDAQPAEETPDAPSEAASAAAETEAEYEAPGPFLEQLEKATEQYLLLAGALVEDNSEDAVRYSGLMRETLAETEAGTLGEEALDFWSEQWGIIDMRARELEEEADIEAQRLQFEYISEAMIRLIDGFDPLSFEVYVQRCPMVREGSADWVSRSEDILNPYHGDRMLTCGSVVREL